MRSPAGDRLKVLFVCSRNQWRSPTAEAVWRHHPALAVRSAGTSASARRKLALRDVEWADVIFFMEHEHKSRAASRFGPALRQKSQHVLEIPDEYQVMDPELVELLEDSVAQLLGLQPPA